MHRIHRLSMVRSLIEYCWVLSALAPDEDEWLQELKSVQKTFESRIAGRKHLYYWDRLAHPSLTSLLTEMWALHSPPYVENCFMVPATSNNLNIHGLSPSQVIPSKCLSSSAANKTLLDKSFVLLGPIFGIAMTNHLNTFQDTELFKIHISLSWYFWIK